LRPSLYPLLQRVVEGGRDEILFFKLTDGDHSRAWRVPRSAFQHKTARATQARYGIEFRTVAYFE
jgi:hypothetical protein